MEIEGDGLQFTIQVTINNKYSICYGLYTCTRGLPALHQCEPIRMHSHFLERRKLHANKNWMQNIYALSRPKSHALSNGALVFLVSQTLCTGKWIELFTGELVLEWTSIFSPLDSTYRKPKRSHSKERENLHFNLHLYLYMVSAFLKHMGMHMSRYATTLCLPHSQQHKQTVTYLINNHKINSPVIQFLYKVLR
jgi:hypothetical protein